MKGWIKNLFVAAATFGFAYGLGKACYNLGKAAGTVSYVVGKTVGKVGSQVNQKNDIPTKEEPGTKSEETTDDEEKEEEPKKQNFVTRVANKVSNMKGILWVRKQFGGDRSLGILGSILKNPDSTRIEAYVANGGIQISVKPRAS